MSAPSVLRLLVTLLVKGGPALIYAADSAATPEMAPTIATLLRLCTGA